MEQVEMNNMYINIDVNNGSEKCWDSFTTYSKTDRFQGDEQVLLLL